MNCGDQGEVGGAIQVGGHEPTVVARGSGSAMGAGEQRTERSLIANGAIEAPAR